MQKLTGQMPRAKNETPKATIDAAWFSGRAKERGLSIAQLSRAVCGTGHKDLLGRALAGNRKLQPEELVKLSAALAAPLAVIFERLGLPTPSATVPLTGRVNEFGRIMFYPPELVKEVPAPTDLSRQLVCVEIDAPNSKLGTWHGVHLYYEPAMGVRLNAIGRLSVIELGDQESCVVGTIDATVGRSTVLVLGGVDRIESNQIKSATPVLWTHTT
jgi:hypothetical protein